MGKMLDPQADERQAPDYRVVEICAGAGGQSLGLELAGFAHELAVEVAGHLSCDPRLRRAFSPYTYVRRWQGGFLPSKAGASGTVRRGAREAQ